MLHSWYSVINLRADVKLTDDVHKHSGIDDPRPEANFSNIILKLQPYWEYLTTNKKPMTFYKEKNNSAIYQKGADGVYYPINSGVSFKRLYGEFSSNDIQEVDFLEPKGERLGLMI